jgi:hypothetical protein
MSFSPQILLGTALQKKVANESLERTSKAAGIFWFQTQIQPKRNRNDAGIASFSE